MYVVMTLQPSFKVLNFISYSDHKYLQKLDHITSMFNYVCYDWLCENPSVTHIPFFEFDTM